jgi:hypothetical protein
LDVLYECGYAKSPTQQLQPSLEIASTGATSVSLAGVTVRYYFTSDGGQSPQFTCDFAAIGCDKLSGSFHPWVGTKSDTYLEVAFTGGTIGPMGNTGPMQLRINDKAFVDYDQTNDYSFDATKTSYAPWQNVTLYQNGVRFWGVEP